MIIFCANRMPIVRFRRLRTICMAYGIELHQQGKWKPQQMADIELHPRLNNDADANVILSAVMNIHTGLQILEGIRK